MGSKDLPLDGDQLGHGYPAVHCLIRGEEATIPVLHLEAAPGHAAKLEDF